MSRRRPVPRHGLVTQRSSRRRRATQRSCRGGPRRAAARSQGGARGRRRTGSSSTVLDVVARAGARDERPAAGLRVLDPACGDGRFLAAAAARIDRRFGASSGRDRPALVGIDLDAATAADGEGATRHRRSPSCVGDALRMVHQERFDVVVGNPPFLNQLARATTRRRPLEHGGGPYADAAVEFLGPGPALGPARRRARRARPATVGAREPRCSRHPPSGGRSRSPRRVVVVGRRDGVRRPGAHRGRRLRARRAPAVRAALAGRGLPRAPSGRRHRARRDGRRGRTCWPTPPGSPWSRPAPTACSATGPPPPPASATSSTA